MGCRAQNPQSECALDGPPWVICMLLMDCSARKVWAESRRGCGGEDKVCLWSSGGWACKRGGGRARAATVEQMHCVGRGGKTQGQWLPAALRFRSCGVFAPVALQSDAAGA